MAEFQRKVKFLINSHALLPSKITYIESDELCFTIKSGLNIPLTPPQFCNELVFISLSALSWHIFSGATGRNNRSSVASEEMDLSENPLFWWKAVATLTLFLLISFSPECSAEWTPGNWPGAVLFVLWTEMLSFMSHACFPAPFKLMAQAWDKGSAAGPGGVSCTTPDSAEHSAEQGAGGWPWTGCRLRNAPRIWTSEFWLVMVQLGLPCNCCCWTSELRGRKPKGGRGREGDRALQDAGFCCLPSALSRRPCLCLRLCPWWRRCPQGLCLWVPSPHFPPPLPVYKEGTEVSGSNFQCM